MVHRIVADSLAGRGASVLVARGRQSQNFRIRLKRDCYSVYHNPVLCICRKVDALAGRREGVFLVAPCRDGDGIRQRANLGARTSSGIGIDGDGYSLSGTGLDYGSELQFDAGQLVTCGVVTCREHLGSVPRQDLGTAQVCCLPKVFDERRHGLRGGFGRKTGKHSKQRQGQATPQTAGTRHGAGSSRTETL